MTASTLCSIFLLVGWACAAVAGDPSSEVAAALQEQIRSAHSAVADILLSPLTSSDAADRPQSKAVAWLATVDAYPRVRRGAGAMSYPGLLQRYALAVLYYATDGPNWAQCSDPLSGEDNPCENNEARFLSPASECGWHGVNCRDDKVTWLDLTGNNLRGMLPDELVLLGGNVELMWLSDNEGLTGVVPTWIGEWQGLQSLSLFNTGLGGSLPESLYGLKNLSALRLYGSHFTGTISRKVSNLENLSWLWIHGNQFTATLPVELASLKKLEGLTVHGNSFDDAYGRSNTMEELCNLRRKEEAGQNGRLEHLWTDCTDGGDSQSDGEQKSCECCTRCFPHSGRAQKNVELLGK